MMLRSAIVVVAALALAAQAASDANDDVFFTDGTAEGSCELNVRLLWSVETGSAIVAAPLITDLHSDGRKEVVLPTFTHYFEALDGATGNDLHGWPFMHPKLRSQASPKMFDIEHDGTPELLVSTYDGELVFFRENGTAIEGATIKMPRVEVKKAWADFSQQHQKEADMQAETAYEAILSARHHLAVRGNAKPTEAPATVHENLKFKDGSQVQHGAARDVGIVHPGHVTPPAHHADGKAATQPPATPAQHAQTQPPAQQPTQPQATNPAGRKLQQVTSADDDIDRDYITDMDAAAAAEGQTAHDGGGAPDPEADPYPERYPYDDDYYGDDAFGHGDAPHEMSHEQRIAGTDGKLSAEARASLDLIFHPELFEAAHNEINTPDRIFRPRADQVPPVHHGSDRIWLDAHILATPAVTDLDYDGSWDIVVPVSYFYDAEFYANPDNEGVLPVDIDPANYVKGTLVVVDARTGRIKWTRDLGMSTKHQRFPAYLLGSPTIINLDDDGMLDIIIGAADGTLHAFDAHGNAKRGWPVKVGPMHGQPLVEDVNGDGHVDVCVTDVRGTVSCFDRHGVVVWDRTVLHPVADGAVAGDVNGDGILDVVLCTTDGKIWALDGRLGGSIPGFPVSIGAPGKGAAVIGTPLLVNLNNTAPPRSETFARGLHIVVTAHDGAMYIVSGTTACVERHDIGHYSYTPVLADDVVGNGFVDLVVTTLTGQVLVFETDAPFTPLKAWPSQVIGMNGLTARDGHLGVLISPESRTPRHVRGEAFNMMFEIVDRRAARLNAHVPSAYFVAIHVGHQLLLFTRLYLSPGKHTVRVPVPYERKYATVYVSMRLPNGMHFEDSTAIAFNMHFMDGIKWLVLIPFLAVMAVLAFVHKRHELEPSSSYYEEEMYLHAQLQQRRRVRRPGLGY